MGAYEDGFLPGFQQINNPNVATYGYADDNAPCICNHMTVGLALSPSYVASHKVPPQLWGNPYDGGLYQTGSLRRPGKALYQPQYGNSWTNRHNFLIQIEIVGIPRVNVVTYTPEQEKWIGENIHAPIIKWFRDMGIPYDETKVVQVTDSSGSASEYWPGRFSDAEMAAARGMFAHINVRGNDHWDVSVERQNVMLNWALAKLGNGIPIPNPTPDPETGMIKYPLIEDEFKTTYIMYGHQIKPVTGPQMQSHRVIGDVGDFVKEPGNPNANLVVNKAVLYDMYDVLPLHMGGQPLET